MKLGLYGGILVFISGFLPLIGGATGYWGVYFGYVDFSHIVLGIIIAAIPLLPQFNIDIEAKLLALGVLALGALAALWGLYEKITTKPARKTTTKKKSTPKKKSGPKY